MSDADLPNLKVSQPYQGDDVAGTLDRALDLHQQGRLAQAEKLYREILVSAPSHFDAIHMLGAIRLQQGDIPAAVSLFQDALKINPASHAARSNLGTALRNLGQFDEALHIYDEALRIRPDYVEALTNRGILLQDMDRLDDALESLDRALRIRPDYVDALVARGNTLVDLRRIDEAVESYERALNVNSGLADAHHNHALALLLKGNFAEGLREYEYRWRRKTAKKQRHEQSTQWLGEESIAGKRLLVWSEQGLGDTLQFCRYVPLLSEMSVQVIVEVQPSLKRLLQSLKGGASLIGWGDAVLPEHDYQIPMLSLPLAFRTEVGTIPCQVPYLRADPERIQGWRKRLGQTGKPKIGLVCSGSVIHKNDRNRSIALELFEPLLQYDIEIYLVQKEVRESDEPYLKSHPRIQDMRVELSDFGDTAALVQCMDLVISVDTSVAHLAGALGKSVWVILPFSPDWRWLLGREDSPWYPTARLFRQREIGNWMEVIARVVSRISEMAERVFVHRKE